MDIRLIETPSFPVNEINKASASEKIGGGRPKFWEMAFWWTRKPLIGARAVIAASLLPADVDIHDFKYSTRLSSLGERSIPHRLSPSIPPKFRERFAKARLLDPFAGFGSIPLEALRLGVREVVAAELLPTAYVLLKAVLEYPRYGERLAKDVEKWGRWVTERLREDPEVKELYDENVAAYIGTWEVKCPHCGNYTPIVGSWWLARTAGREKEGGEEEEGVRRSTFRRLVWMSPRITGNEVFIEIVDPNRELGVRKAIARVNARQGIVEIDGNRYNVPRPNVDTRREVTTCLLCNNTIGSGKREEWYVKRALNEWNQNLEQYLRGEISLETLLNSSARPKILARVKVEDKELEFERATQKDTDKLWKALERLRQIWGDPDIPTEPLWPYTSSAGGPRIWGFDKFYKLFNPRQLLVLVKLVKLIREAGKRIEEEKLREGKSREEALEHAEAVTTYLSIALIKYADYNALPTSWDPDFLKARYALAFKGIAMTWNWADVNPFEQSTGSWARNLETVRESIEHIAGYIKNVSGAGKARVLLDDATVLSKLGDEKFDLIVTDPPYRYDVPYAELSDLYYVWLKRALSDVANIGGVLIRVPRFLREAFFDEYDNEIETQWRTFAPREVSEEEGRAAFFGVIEGKPVGSFEHFKGLLTKSFISMAKRLADDGLLVTYYAHTSPDAWEALLEAGWRCAKLKMTAAYPLLTEMAHRVTAMGTASLDMSIVTVWKKGASGEAHIDQAYAEAVEKCEKAAREYQKRLRGVDLFVAVLGSVLSHFTRYERLIGVKDVKSLVENYVYPATAEAIARSLGAAAGSMLSPASMFYLLSKTLVHRRPGQVRRVLDRSTTIILSIGTRSDLMRLEGSVIERENKGESKGYTLLEPRWGLREPRAAVNDVLSKKGLDPGRPIVRTAVDVLHLLEYYAVALPKDALARRVEELKTRHPQFFEEAMTMAQMLARSLPEEDPEKELAEDLLRALGAAPQGAFTDYFSR